MTFKKPDREYWNRKFIAYMHDPLDKIFKIQGHEKRAAAFLEKYGLQATNDEFWKKADGIAAGFERGQVPSYSADPNKTGAVDFLKNPIITHPTSEKGYLTITFSDSNDVEADCIFKELLEFIEKDIGIESGQGGLSEKFKGDEDRFAAARFFYNHLALRFKLSEENVGGLGAFWHRIPADSRFPDHSIWQHNALCSSLSSCIELSSGDVSEIGMMVFSVSPVQQFISKARKLRDFWTGSVLLSWLSFEGMRWVIENLGPDHILYPSLIDQPLINEYMQKIWNAPQDGFMNPPKDIASFPNKFLFLIPMNQAETIAEEIKKHVQAAWKKLYEKVYETTISKLNSYLTSDEKKACVKEIFDRQNSGFWDLQWAASYLVTDTDRAEIETLLPESVYKNPFEFLDRFNKIIKDKTHYDKSGRSILYSVSHSLAQSNLAAYKNRKTVTRLPETGEKCHLCGEFEVVHHVKYKGDISADTYKNNTKDFWKNLKTKWDGDEKHTLGFNLNDNEKLCSICLTKRMVCEVIESDKKHMLHAVFNDKKSFPSTTEISLTHYFKREEIKKCSQLSKAERKKIAQEIHDQPDDKTDSHDRYYAILLMDGDRMGKLVNGETLASTWESIMHPIMVERLKDSGFDKKYHENWKPLFPKKRLVTPAIHASISEALGDFSLYGVDGIIKKHDGKLIYAGGDDVCAVLPVETSFIAAQEIQRYYTSTYKWIPKDRENQAPKDVTESFGPKPGKLSINLGKGDDISISAGILICHHKENLAQMIDKAQHLLKDKAKKEAGRDACAIELRKRSGGSRFFVRKWSEEETWKSFSEIGDAITSKNKTQVSTSVVYRLELLRDGVEAILKHDNRKEMLEKLIFKQLDRSSVGDDTQKDFLAKKMADLVVSEDNYYKPDGLIVAAFMAKGGEDNGLV